MNRLATPADPARAQGVAPAAPSAARPEEYVRRILQSEDFPAFSRHMSQLMGSMDEGEASAQRLANLVLRDYALTVKVIRTANTLHYNRTGRPVQSATQAMMLLGARTVRALASELLLFEQYRKRSPGLKELMLLSLLTAGHAREAAARLGLSDPEAAQLAGMFRNLGEVLVAAHLPQEYSAVLRETPCDGTRSGTRAREGAAVHVLGCSFEDIGVAIATHWGMPDHVCQGMRANGRAEEHGLDLIAAFAHDLTAAIHRAGPATARQAMTAVSETYGERLRLSREVLAAVADGAINGTRDAFAAAGVALDDLRLARQVTHALDEASPSARPTPTVQPTAEAPLPAAPAIDGAALAALREQLAGDLEAAAGDRGGYDLQRALLIALEAGLRGGPFDHVCFCAPDARVTELRARLSLGERSETLATRLRIPVAASGAGRTLLSGGEVLLDTHDRLAPPELAILRGAGAAAAWLLPVVVDGVAIGCIYFDRVARGEARATIDTLTLSYMRRLVQTLTRAVATRREPAIATVPADDPPAPTQRGGTTLCADDKAAAVLRLLKGECATRLSTELGLTIEQLERWRVAFLAGAVARLAAD